MNLYIFVVFVCSLFTVQGDRTSQKIYYDVTSIAACFRRLNSTHQIGCNSGREGNTGVLHYIESEEDAEWLVDKGPDAPYVALFNPYTFTRELVMKLGESGKISGMLVIHSNDTDKPDKFSPDKPCPNDLLSRYQGDTKYEHCKEQVWNREGNSLFFQDFPFPILAVTNSTEVNEGLIERCYNQFNKPIDGEPRPFPLCSAEVKVAMDAAKDTPTCIRRSKLQNNLNPQQFCDPLEYFSVYGFVHPINDPNTTQQHNIIMASARMDSFSMFEDIYPSADSSVSSIVTLLAAASALGKVKDELKAAKPIMFTFLNGEAFDYIGSQRIVYDMEQGKFPWNAAGRSDGPPLIKPSNIEQYLEVGQVGKQDQGAVWLHTDPLSPDSAQREALLVAIQNASISAGLPVQDSSHMQPLPPASLQTFLQASDHIAGVLMADHNTTFSNKYYNSRFDTAEEIGHTYPPGVNGTERYDIITPAAQWLTQVANTVARTLYTQATGNLDTGHVNVTELEMTHLLYCFLLDAKCDLFNETLPESHFKQIPADKPLTYYVGVRYSAHNNPTFIIKQLLGYYLGNNVTNATSKEECNDMSSTLYDYVWINGPVNKTSPDESRIPRCVQISSNRTVARSPAFDIDDYDWSSNKYSAWTESRWANSAINLRVFLIPSKAKEITTLCVGLGLVVVSFAVVIVVSLKAKVIFAEE